MKVHILDDWYDTLRALPGFAALEGHEVTVWTDRLTDETELADRLSEADAVVLYRDRTAITPSLAARLTGPKLIAMRGQHSHVDAEALARAGILFCAHKAKDGPSTSTAELAFGLIIAALRYLPEQIASARAGQWQGGAPLGRNVGGRVLGLYGYGRIAGAVAGFARAFGMTVQVWASDEGRARAKAEGAHVPESREAFFASSDVISLHKRLTPETRGEISQADLMAMSPESVLVNTSRAGLIAPGALHAALEAGRIGRAALDVFDGEPITDPADPLLSHPRVIPTPHVGFVTAEELDRQFRDIYALINAYAGGAPQHMVNPEVWSPEQR
ncbi:D-2-hydroxyacid dehydrogenase family protein [Poseidonocella sedimentorum]|uniref:D-3-phosphoglycerate dehydrogenase n=1 Tax=Poseidonocella sedimentorum TaxID=871652 RepID=A0A1I6ED99_9RHOB|nr:D-2-hydroxyacid dehydrogenase family protein [Poseidonocella sedimentorum]SFR15498.1 D-3-phosphoglycerate dehydrogenase [Poseidonocella sedimentorum]